MKIQKSRTMQNTGAKPELSFSIANILKVEKPVKGCLNSKQIASGSQASETRKEETSPLKSPVSTNLPWLAYTRYCPPKIPRSRNRKTVNRRKASGSPRVPFSTEQLMKLEKSYEETHYVSAAQVSELSAMLRLPENRIKIWFQNRRAREKKKTRKMSTCQTTSDTCPDTAADRNKPQENVPSVPCPTPFNNFASCSRTQDTFPPSFALRPSNCTYFNNNGWCAMLNLPQTHLFSYFDYSLYKGLTLNV